MKHNKGPGEEGLSPASKNPGRDSLDEGLAEVEESDDLSDEAGQRREEDDELTDVLIIEDII